MERRQNFDEYYQQYLNAADFAKFLEVLNVPSQKALRLNTFLWSSPDWGQFVDQNNLQIKAIPWCPQGFFYQEPDMKSLGNSAEFLVGRYYIQDATSMIPPEILQPQAGEIILDLCSAPGGKTIHLANLMQGQGLIIANEVVNSRRSILRQQLARYQIPNCAVTGYDVTFFSRHYPNFFDKILLDAPCSGEGMRSRKTDIQDNFSLNRLKFNAKRQKRLLQEAFLSLKPGGKIVYSTCALSYDENEAVVLDLLEKFPKNAELLATSLKKYPGISTPESKLKKTIRIWPFYLNTNGFFVAHIKKTAALPIIPQKSPKFSNLKPHLGPNWQLLNHKETLQILNFFSRCYNLPTLDFGNFCLLKFRKEIWIQPRLLARLSLPYLNYAGLKIAEYNNSSILQSVIFSELINLISNRSRFD